MRVASAIFWIKVLVFVLLLVIEWGDYDYDCEREQVKKIVRATLRGRLTPAALLIAWAIALGLMTLAWRLGVRARAVRRRRARRRRRRAGRRPSGRRLARLARAVHDRPRRLGRGARAARDGQKKRVSAATRS